MHGDDSDRRQRRLEVRGKPDELKEGRKKNYDYRDAQVEGSLHRLLPFPSTPLTHIPLMQLVSRDQRAELT